MQYYKPIVKGSDRKIFGIKVGDTIQNRTVENSDKYLVTEVFRNILYCKNQRGKQFCFNLGDLVMMGIQPFYPTNENCDMLDM